MQAAILILDRTLALTLPNLGPPMEPNIENVKSTLGMGAQDVTHQRITSAS